MKRTLLALLAALGLAVGLVGLTGCGGGSSSSAPSISFTTIGVNDSATGEISSTDPASPDGTHSDFYLVTLPTAGTLTVNMSSSAVDSYLLLYNEAEELLAEDDDSGGGANALITISLAAGTYAIEANTSAVQIGSYTLTTNFMPDPQRFTIQVGEFVTGELSADDASYGEGRHYEIWAVTLSSSVDLTVYMTSAEMDSYLKICDANGDVMAEDNDSGGGTNGMDAQLTVSLPPGTYYIWATTNSVDEFGSYALTTSISETPLGLTIGVNDSVTGDVTSTDPEYGDGWHYDSWEVTLSSAGDLTVNMTSAEIDSFLEIRDINGDLLAQNNSGGGGGLNAQLTVSLTAGTYYIRATTNYVDEFGSYTLTTSF